MSSNNSGQIYHLVGYHFLDVGLQPSRRLAPLSLVNKIDKAQEVSRSYHCWSQYDVMAQNYPVPDMVESSLWPTLPLRSSSGHTQEILLNMTILWFIWHLDLEHRPCPYVSILSPTSRHSTQHHRIWHPHLPGSISNLRNKSRSKGHLLFLGSCPQSAEILDKTYLNTKQVYGMVHSQQLYLVKSTNPKYRGQKDQSNHQRVIYSPTSNSWIYQPG